MIVEIEGVVGEKQPGMVVVRTSGGLSYGVEVPGETEQHIGSLGSSVHLYTHLIVREDQWRLIGFHEITEKVVFQELLEVNGVGIKGALSVMSHLGIKGLQEAVLAGDWQTLKGAPGIGAKIAQRIQLELMGRWAKSSQALNVANAAGPPTAPSTAREDEVLAALTSLGYQRLEAESVVRELSASAPEARLREALKALDRGRAR